MPKDYLAIRRPKKDLDESRTSLTGCRVTTAGSGSGTVAFKHRILRQSIKPAYLLSGKPPLG